MSNSKIPRIDGAAQDRKPFGASTLYNVPVLSERFDRFCTNCSAVIESAALEKYSGLKCNRCQMEVEFIDKSDGNYRRCVRCFVFLRCTAKFCYLCGRNNHYFDPEKPARLEKAVRAQIAAAVKKEVAEAAEVNSLSQSLLEDEEKEGWAEGNAIKAGTGEQLPTGNESNELGD